MKVKRLTDLAQVMLAIERLNQLRWGGFLQERQERPDEYELLDDRGYRH